MTQTTHIQRLIAKHTADYAELTKRAKEAAECSLFKVHVNIVKKVEPLSRMIDLLKLELKCYSLLTEINLN